MEDENKIEVHDKRRIKSADDTLDEEDESFDLDRFPTYVKQLEDKVEAHDSRLKEYISAHKEKVAEMDKVRKRIENDAERLSLAKFGELVAELLPVIDDFDRAMESAKENGADDPLLKGVALLRARLFEALTKSGLEMIDCLNQQFDPEIAQAIGTITVDDSARDNVVLEQLAPGYRIGERILRPAMVRVGHKP